MYVVVCRHQSLLEKEKELLEQIKALQNEITSHKR